MAQEPVIKTTVDLPYNHVFAIRLTPWTVRRTVIRLLPWALVLMAPRGSRRARLARGAANMISPPMRQR